MTQEVPRELRPPSAPPFSSSKGLRCGPCLLLLVQLYQQTSNLAQATPHVCSRAGKSKHRVAEACFCSISGAVCGCLHAYGPVAGAGPENRQNRQVCAQVITQAEGDPPDMRMLVQNTHRHPGRGRRVWCAGGRGRQVHTQAHSEAT